MGLAFALTIPGLVVVLVVLGAVDRLVRRRKGAALAATAWAELDAGLQPGKRLEMEERRAEASRRDDVEDGAPPRSTVDLDGGIAIVRPASPGQSRG